MPVKRPAPPTSYITLSALAAIVSGAVDSVSSDQWVVAELAGVNVNKFSGHCYLELVEKEGDKTIAQMRATIWAGVYKRIDMVFRRATGTELKPGMKVLMRGSLTFHEVYGLSLNVREIDPAFTLGEMALKRKDTLERLKKEGVLELNRLLEIPPVPQRIAVIASETSAGYGDFIHRMTGNPYGYTYDTSLFSAVVQGDGAEKSITAALNKVSKKAKHFDVVVLIRGGGSQVDLSCFDSYALAAMVARFPLPVLSGIGHERDETVMDHVANRRLITPSAVAEFIVARTREFEDALDGLMQRLIRSASVITGHENHRLAMAGRSLLSSAEALVGQSRYRLVDNVHAFSSVARMALGQSSARLTRLGDGLASGIRALLSGAAASVGSMGLMLRTGSLHRLRHEPDAVSSLERRVERVSHELLARQGQRLGMLQAKAELLDPANVLKRGYSITMLGDRVLKGIGEITKGDRIKTVLYDGTITSTIEETEKDNNEGG